jgi:CHASE3 domain sensor protein
MNDRSMHDAALVREGRARRRRARALEHQMQAELEAAAATDPEIVRRLRREAKLYGRAAQLHERAIASQAEHARGHAVNKADV